MSQLAQRRTATFDRFLNFFKLSSNQIAVCLSSQDRKLRNVVNNQRMRYPEPASETPVGQSMQALLNSKILRRFTDLLEPVCWAVTLSTALGLTVVH